jgi:hypothetical protein
MSNLDLVWKLCYLFKLRCAFIVSLGAYMWSASAQARDAGLGQRGPKSH